MEATRITIAISAFAVLAIWTAPTLAQVKGFKPSEKYGVTVAPTNPFGATAPGQNFSSPPPTTPQPYAATPAPTGQPDTGQSYTSQPYPFSPAPVGQGNSSEMAAAPPPPPAQIPWVGPSPFVPPGLVTCVPDDGTNMCTFPVSGGVPPGTPCHCGGSVGSTQ